MQIRVATDQDFEEICSLFTSEEEVFWIYPGGIYPFTTNQLQCLSEVRQDLTVGVDDGKVIGFANLYNFEPGQYLFIGNVVVSTEYRGKGLGRELVAHMLDLATNKYTLPEVRIAVFSNNIRALLLYSSFGFSPYQVEERKDFSGKRVALIKMKLRRGPFNEG